MPAFKVRLNDVVVADDLPKLPRNIQERIIRAIRARLTTEPSRYGVRLRKSLIGLWKIRVGDYRVIYELCAEGSIRVWAIGNRRDVYPETVRRWVK